MTGVEILSTNIVYETLFPIWLIVVTFLLLSTSFIILIVNVLSDNYNIALAILPIMILLFVILGIGTGVESDDIAYIEHDVVISDDTSMVEFYNTYEIVDCKGRIYTVRERAYESDTP